MPEPVLAATMIGRWKTEICEYPFPQTPPDARNGTILFGAAPAETPPDFRIADLLARRLTQRPCRGNGFESVVALKNIASGRYPLQLMATHRFSLGNADLAIRSVGGQGAPGARHVTVFPWS